MKVEWEFYKFEHAIELLPTITIWWPSDMQISWLRWGIDIEFHRDNAACR